MKLSKLWQAGEAFDAAETIRFGWQGGRGSAWTLAAAVFNEPALAERSVPIRVGTIQLVTSEWMGSVSWGTIWETVLANKLDEENGGASGEFSAETRLETAEVIALGGIVQGLLDFAAISGQELGDAFAPLDVDESGLCGVHKGTVLSIAESDRGYKAAVPTIGISPYLLLPQAVLLHNEEQLDEAERAATRPSGEGRLRMHQALANYLPNVFHYAAEQRLLDEGDRSRGLRVRRMQLEAQLAEVDAEWESRVTHRREIADAVRNALLLVLAGLALKGILPLSVLLPVFTAAAALYVLVTLLSATRRRCSSETKEAGRRERLRLGRRHRRP